MYRGVRLNVVNVRIKNKRLSLNLTLADVADYLGVKEATAQRYESGEIKNIKHETIVKLAELFKCRPAYLMGWEDETEIIYEFHEKIKQLRLKKNLTKTIASSFETEDWTKEELVEIESFIKFIKSKRKK